MNTFKYSALLTFAIAIAPSSFAQRTAPVHSDASLHVELSIQDDGGVDGQESRRARLIERLKGLRADDDVKGEKPGDDKGGKGRKGAKDKKEGKDKKERKDKGERKGKKERKGGGGKKRGGVEAGGDEFASFDGDDFVGGVKGHSSDRGGRSALSGGQRDDRQQEFSGERNTDRGGRSELRSRMQERVRNFQNDRGGRSAVSGGQRGGRQQEFSGERNTDRGGRSELRSRMQERVGNFRSRR